MNRGPARAVVGGPVLIVTRAPGRDRLGRRLLGRLLVALLVAGASAGCGVTAQDEPEILRSPPAPPTATPTATERPTVSPSSTPAPSRSS